MGYKSKYFLQYPTGSKTNRIKLVKAIPQLVFSRHKAHCIDGPFNTIREIKMRLKALGVSLNKYPEEIANEYESIPNIIINQCDEYVEKYYHNNGFSNGSIDYCAELWGDDEKGIHYQIEYFLDGKSYKTNYITIHP